MKLNLHFYLHTFEHRRRPSPFGQRELPVLIIDVIDDSDCRFLTISIKYVQLLMLAFKESSGDVYPLS